MSTASDTDRIPARASRTRIGSGVGAGLNPRTSRSTNRSHAAGSSMLAGCTSAETWPSSEASPPSGSPSWARSPNRSP